MSMYNHKHSIQTKALGNQTIDAIYSPSQFKVTLSNQPHTNDHKKKDAEMRKVASFYHQNVPTVDSGQESPKIANSGKKPGSRNGS